MTFFRAASLSQFPLAMGAGLLALWALIGHLAGARWMFVLLPDTYGMHETTSLAILLLIGVMRVCRNRRQLARGIALAALVLALGRFVPGLGSLYGLEGAYQLAPHTAAMLAVLAAALLIQEYSFFLAATVLFYVTLGGALVQLIANLFELSRLTGAMASGTAAAILLLSVAGMLCHANRGVMRVLLNDHASGRQARAQTLLGVLGPLAFGLLYILLDQRQDGRAEMLLLVATIAGFNIGLITLMAVSVERADHARRMLERQLRHLALRDGLTGLFNRTMLEQRYARATREAERHGVPFCLLMVDFDYFKQINDLGGHALGDRVLCRAAREMRAVLRLEDTLARIGGEEFAVILPGADQKAGVEVAERLRETVLRLGQIEADGVLLPVSASIGLAQWRDGEEFKETLSRADRALYVAKSGGRDRVVLADADSEPGAFSETAPKATLKEGATPALATAEECAAG